MPSRTANPTPPCSYQQNQVGNAFERAHAAIDARVAIGFERSPGRFAQASEEWLRDHIIVTLNTHYEGAATGETFNAAGKTDILVRHGIHNVFIGEAKVWDGEAVLGGAFVQLLSYTTWRDNRLALILFVRAKALAPVMETTRSYLASRPEFAEWRVSPDGQQRCRLQWEDAERRDATLTVFFVHTPA